MKCVNCGAELKVGCIYCSICGHEAQIVPDYNVLEDELLKSYIGEDEKRGQERKEKNGQQEDTGSRKPPTAGNKAGNGASKSSNGKNSKKKKKGILLAGLILALCLIALAVTYSLIKNQRNNSFDYQYEKGMEKAEEKDYTAAIRYLERALVLDEDSTKTMLELAKLYELREDDDSEEANLLQIIELEPKNRAAYQMLIKLYDSQKAYDKIVSLYDAVKDTDLKSLFADYVVLSPEFSEEEGTYADEFELELTAQDGCDIYYSLGDTDPVANGEKYEEPIALEEGDTTINAVAKDARGIYSDVVTATYTIEFQAPSAPSISPGSGSYTQAQPITITVPEGCTAYYTWDGSDPNNESTVYAGPLEMPVGNNILSVLVINGHGLASKIVRYNYIYLP